MITSMLQPDWNADFRNGRNRFDPTVSRGNRSRRHDGGATICDALHRNASGVVAAAAPRKSNRPQVQILVSIRALSCACDGFAEAVARDTQQRSGIHRQAGGQLPAPVEDRHIAQETVQRGPLPDSDGLEPGEEAEFQDPGFASGLGTGRSVRSSMD